jgi:hypothetical protein
MVLATHRMVGPVLETHIMLMSATLWDATPESVMARIRKIVSRLP